MFFASLKESKFYTVRHGLILALIIFFCQWSNVAAAGSAAVVPVDWQRFNKGTPADQLSLVAKNILQNANKYALTTWWNKKGFARQAGGYLNLGGVAENNIRPVADEVFALAVSLKTGAYDARRAGAAEQLATERTKRMIISLAHTHVANSGKTGWGNSWQSALWAGKTGVAGWLMWDKLSTVEQTELRKVVLFEANRFNEYKVPYYRSPNGKINYPGDTKAEENAWNATILQTALAMMPNHPNKKIWTAKMNELMLSAFARPDDVKSGARYFGKSLVQWLNGSNINNDGTLVNQDKLHPDYMSDVSFNVQAALLFGLAGMKVPPAALFNAERIYQALSDGNFFGTNLYQPGSSLVVYPNGNAWGTQRRMNFALLDLEAAIFGFDSLANKKGDYWANLHLRKVLTMQNRSKDGRTYLYYGEDKYAGREEWVAEQAAQAYLVKWLQKQGVL